MPDLESISAPGPSYREVLTARLRLDTVRDDDLDDYYSLHSDVATHPYDPWTRHPDREHSRSRIAEIRQDWDRDRLGYWVIRDLATGRFLGVGGLRRSGYTDRSGRYRSDGSWNAYYRLTKASWGHGYATETMRAAARCCAELDPGGIIRATILRRNRASLRVADAIGLRFLVNAPSENGAPATYFELPAGEVTPASG